MKEQKRENNKNTNRKKYQRLFSFQKTDEIKVPLNVLPFKGLVRDGRRKGNCPREEAEGHKVR